MLAIGRNAVDWHLDVAPGTDGRSQGRQGRLAEQCPHVGTEAGLAHALDQRHRQQRVATQLEEVVVATDLLDLEQVGPDLRQGGFHRALRRFVATTEQRAVIRRGQCLAVQLAIGGQR